MRVMSRSEPPAACSGSCPSTRAAPAWLRRTFASTCGRWLVTATRRSWASGPIATGRAPSDETNPCTSRRRSGSVAAVGVRNHVAPSKRSAVARSGPRVSAPQIGCPPTNRRSPPAAAETGRFVDPTSVTVAPSGARSSASRTTDGSSPTGVATRTRSAAATASAMLPVASTAPRSAATPSESGSGSQPVTDGHARTLGGEPGGRADQTGSDDRQTLGRCHQPVLVAAGSPQAIMQPASARRRGRRHRATAAH